MYAKDLVKDFLAVHGLHDLYEWAVLGGERELGAIFSGFK